MRRRTWVVAALAAAMLVAAVPLLVRGLTIDNGLDVWLAEGSACHDAYLRASESFGTDREVLVAWEAGEPSSPEELERGRALATTLRSIPGVQDTLSLGGFLAGYELSPDDLDEQAWRHPLFEGTLLGRHAQAIVVALAETAPSGAVPALVATAAAADGASGAVHVTGAPVLNHALDVEARRAPATAIPLMVTISVLGLIVAGRLLGVRPRVRFLALPVGAGAAGVLWALAALSITGAPLDMVTETVPGVVWILSVAAGVHVAATAEARQRMERAVVWATLTTAVGFLSLLASGVRPLVSFGLASAVGVAAGSGTALVLGRVWPARSQETGRLAPARVRRGGWIGPVLVVAASAVLAAGTGRLEVHANPLEFLREDHPVVVDYRWSGERFGRMPIQVLVEGADDEVRRQSADDIAATLRDSGVATSALSPLDLHELPEHELSDRLRSRLDDPERGRTLVRVRAAGMDAADLDALRREVAGVPLPAGVSATVTGAVALIVDLQRQLIDAQARSLGIVLGVLAIALGAITRSPLLTAVALIPNLVPAAVVLGTLGWSGRGLDPATAMATAVALGIAVDDTLHILVQFEAEAAGPALDPAQRAVRTVLPAITTTTAVLAAGFASFALATFRPVEDFGLLVALALVSAWVADVVLLRGLLTIVARMRA